MPTRFVWILVVLVCLPLAALAWMALRLARDEQGRVHQRLRELLEGELHDTSQILARHFERRERELIALIERTPLDPPAIREMVRTTPGVRQLFVLAADGRLEHPDPAGELNRSELEFLGRIRDVLVDRDLVHAGGGELATGGSTTSEDGTPGEWRGWYPWYAGRGLNFIFWQRRDDGRIVGIELERARWMADLIAELPETVTSAVPQAAARVRLVDSQGETIYQWGPFEPPDDSEPTAHTALAPPLSAWRLQQFVDAQAFLAASGQGRLFQFASGVAVVAIALVGLAAYFYRESSREFREAVTRINFVNQVSHELKTPLTNIRMYADLLEQDLGGLDEQDTAGLRPRLDVIVAESQRLSRLIGNVLTFARQQRHGIELHRTSGVVDDVIRSVAHRFAPALAAKGIEVEFLGAAGGPASFDHDVLEQILGNLFSNVDKYAAGGKRLQVTRSQADGRTTIRVADQGPGVPREHRDAIFEPFHRLSDRLESVAGVGIGLSIARGLARLHGGDVVLEESESGAVFRVELVTGA